MYSQNKAKNIAPKLKLIACDCKKAIKLTINVSTKYGPTVDTKGYGDIQEIPVHDKHSKYYFETEHNSAWYLLTINVDGELVFDIKPVRPTDDYDFLLFKYTDSTFCKNFMMRKLIPVRSNISRVSDEDSGNTGLSPTSKVEYETRGKGFSYSRSITVKKGEQYMLVLDNVYDSGKGHTIFFHTVKEINFSGKTIGDDSLPIAANISVLEKSGKVVAKTKSDKITGEYNFTIPLQIARKYTLMYYNDSSFFDIKTLLVGANQRDSINYKPVVLAKLKEDKAYKLKNILFYGDSSGILPESETTLEGLYDFLIIHNKMKICIEGHIHPSGGRSLNWNQQLSERRAMAVYTYLVNRGIEKERLSTKGFGGTRPLFPGTASEFLARQNRRVEIRIISTGE